MNARGGEEILFVCGCHARVRSVVTALRDTRSGIRDAGCVIRDSRRVSRIPHLVSASRYSHPETRIPSPTSSLHLLNIRHRPALVEAGFCKRVKPEVGEPNLARNCRNPVLLEPLWCGQDDVNLHRAGGIFHQILPGYSQPAVRFFSFCLAGTVHRCDHGRAVTRSVSANGAGQRQIT
jgi:hypothetical protein